MSEQINCKKSIALFMAGLIAKTSSANFNSGNGLGLQNNLMKSNFPGVNNRVAKQQTVSKTINTQNTPSYTQSPLILTAPSTYSGFSSRNQANLSAPKINPAVISSANTAQKRIGSNFYTPNALKLTAPSNTATVANKIGQSKNLQFRPAISSSVNSAANRATKNFSISKPAVSSLSAPKFSAGSKYYSAIPKTSAQIKSGAISYKSAPYFGKTNTGKTQSQNKLSTQSTNLYSRNIRATSQAQPNSSSYLKSSSVNSYSNLSAGKTTANLQRPYSNQQLNSSIRVNQQLSQPKTFTGMNSNSYHGYYQGPVTANKQEAIVQKSPFLSSSIVSTLQSVSSVPVNNYIQPNINKDTTQSASGANIGGQQSVTNGSGVNINTSTKYSVNSPVNNDVTNVSGNNVFVGVDI